MTTHFHPVARIMCGAINPLVGFEVLTAVVMKSSIFWDTTLCRTLKVNQRSFKTSVDIKWTTWSHIPEDKTRTPPSHISSQSNAEVSKGTVCLSQL
jgi:hypothetical protein